MTKDYAKYLFGGTQKMANAVGVTRQAIYNWPDELEQKQADLVIGAAFRLDIVMVESLAGLLRKQ